MQDHIKSTVARIIVVTTITAGSGAALSAAAMADAVPAKPLTVVSVLTSGPIVPPASVPHNTPWG
ncbi:hypothetical protein [Sphaerisporangium corydalis]|uniref:Secreted protein n=1 Tax=Sphaerisporangium corydalis TaxID=1441875 RepID=A0ABV9ES51_9ACTN|nr:hypothetical protein [Sphaerisporangium corydalis]